eukprot:UN03455
MKQQPKSRQHHKNNQAHKRAAKKTHAVRQHKRGVKQMANKKQLQNNNKISQQYAPLGLTMSGATHKQQNMNSSVALLNSSAIRRFADQSKNNNENNNNNNNNTDATQNNNTTDAGETEGTAREQLKKLGAKGFVKKFGKSFVYSYLGIYVGFLGALTGAFSVIPGLDAQSAIDWAMSTGHIDRPVAAFNSFLDSVPAIGEPIRNNKKFFSNFAAAWCVTKFTEPIRLPIAAALTLKVHAKLNPQAEASRDSAV